MASQRQIEIFSAGCGVCQAAIDLVNRMACSSCDVTVHDMNDAAVTQRAQTLGIQSVPAIVIDGRLTDCCAGRGVDEAALRRAGVGQPMT
jgi:glutaredoxin 3